MYATACVTCYQQIHDHCPHFTVRATHQRRGGSRQFDTSLTIRCACEQSTVVTCRPQQQFAAHNCCCGQRLLYVASNEVITPKHINLLTRLPYPRAQCASCSGRGKRVVTRFSRCENCDGTGGKKTTPCVLCDGDGAIAGASTEVACVDCVA